MKKINKTTRDEDGLISGIEYHFNEDGSINWRKMVKQEHLVPNKQRTKDTDVSKLDDRDLLILLGGIKELSQMRGYTEVFYDVTSPSPDYVVAVCKINWVPNYETDGKCILFSAIGDASLNNTQGFAKYYLGPIAENRAFVRCVRNFLKINIVSQEEVSGQKTTTQETVHQENENVIEPKSFLESIMKNKKIEFKQIKQKLIKENYPEAETFNSIEDVPKSKIFELIERIQKV